MKIQKKTALLILVGFAALFILFLFKVKDDMVDFQVNYLAAKRLSLGETLYRFEDEHYMFKYLPSSAFLYLPFSLLPLDMAKGIWFFISVLCTVLLLNFAFQTMPFKNTKSLYLLGIPPLLLARYFLRELQLGQVNALVTMILLAMIFLLAKKKQILASRNETYAGLLLGLAVALKPYALIFFPYFFIKKKWRVLFCGTFVLALSILAPSLYYGFRGNFIVHKEWISTLFQSTPLLLSSQDNISWIAFFTKWTNDPHLSPILAALTTILAGSAFLLAISKGKDIRQSMVLESSILLLFIPLFSPLGWDYTLLMSVLGIMICINSFSVFSKFNRVLFTVNGSIIFFSFYDLMGKKLYAQFMSFSVITICFSILLVFLLALRFKNAC